MTADDLLLIPRPRELHVHDDHLDAPTANRAIFLDAATPADLLVTAELLLEDIEEFMMLEAHISASPGYPALVTLKLDPDAVAEPQGYRLQITPDAITITGHDGAGVFYGTRTLAQLLAQFAEAPPCLEIHDYPDFAARGIMLDVSRDKVPELQTVLTLVDKLAGVKLNQLQLYMEHTFAYPEHETVWAKASPFTPEEILELDAYCQERFVELAPNQNSFGHMERWLRHEEYKDLAEAPDGATAPWGGHLEPFSICPGDPRSRELLENLYDELLPNFTSPLFNVGCDETWDLGQGRSKAECEERGTGRVYLDFLLQTHELVTARGRRMMFWGDIINNHPELIPELPEDIVAMEWGYGAEHPFDENCARYKDAGIPFYVCPGTSSWNTFTGRTKNAMANLENAAKNGHKHGAIGYLITDWGDCGHWQYLPVSYLGFAYGAACSWGVEENCGQDIQAPLSLHLFHDASGASGEIAAELGNAYLETGKEVGNGTIFFRILMSGLEDTELVADMDAEKWRQAADFIAATAARIGSIESDAPDAELVVQEFELGARTISHACNLAQFKLALRAETDHEVLRGWARTLAAELEIILAGHVQLWLARNRPGGLVDSYQRLEKRLTEYLEFAAE